MPTTTDTYPIADTHAARILEFIQSNPGTTRNAIISGLDLNPSIVRRYAQALLERGLIVDTPNDSGYHSYTAKEAK